MPQTIRGLDHIGITVPDIEAATTFLEGAFGAEVIYQTLTKEDKPQQGGATEHRLHLAQGASIRAIRMLRLQNGPGIELFEMQSPHQQPAARPSDLGLQHMALYVDDVSSATSRFKAAGGTIFSEPHPLPPLESGKDNLFCYGITPWGMMVEFVSYPTTQPYTQETSLRRWTPAPTQ
ncbi:VOC family protein [Granulicella sibirica]|uniref:VOC domain-containing protein n=1 Tax=Granulicella sibirica TaxID=2479048 RepID=A0A4Q0SZN6_9BACT|nr:VOC family protein [Granulicella sibirica]RXH56367.1 hypothetical protein GRAN_3224 [Granulicella sibirica]